MGVCANRHFIMDSRSNLSPTKRAKIVALSKVGFYQRRIVVDLRCSQAAVGDVIRRFRETGSQQGLTLFWTTALFHTSPGALPTNDISIEIEIRPKFAVLCFKMCSYDHNEILHTSRQCNCRDVCKISLWSVAHIIN